MAAAEIESCTAAASSDSALVSEVHTQADVQYVAAAEIESCNDLNEKRIPLLTTDNCDISANEVRDCILQFRSASSPISEGFHAPASFPTSGCITSLELLPSCGTQSDVESDLALADQKGVREICPSTFLLREANSPCAAAVEVAATKSPPIVSIAASNTEVDSTGAGPTNRNLPTNAVPFSPVIFFEPDSIEDMADLVAVKVEASQRTNTSWSLFLTNSPDSNSESKLTERPGMVRGDSEGHIAARTVRRRRFSPAHHSRPQNFCIGESELARVPIIVLQDGTPHGIVQQPQLPQRPINENCPEASIATSIRSSWFSDNEPSMKRSKFKVENVVRIKKETSWFDDDCCDGMVAHDVQELNIAKAASREQMTDSCYVTSINVEAVDGGNDDAATDAISVVAESTSQDSVIQISYPLQVGHELVGDELVNRTKSRVKRVVALSVTSGLQQTAANQIDLALDSTRPKPFESVGHFVRKKVHQSRRVRFADGTKLDQSDPRYVDNVRLVRQRNKAVSNVSLFMGGIPEDEIMRIFSPAVDVTPLEGTHSHMSRNRLKCIPILPMGNSSLSGCLTPGEIFSLDGAIDRTEVSQVQQLPYGTVKQIESGEDMDQSFAIMSSSEALEVVQYNSMKNPTPDRLIDFVGECPYNANAWRAPHGGDDTESCMDFLVQMLEEQQISHDSRSEASPHLSDIDINQDSQHFSFAEFPLHRNTFAAPRSSPTQLLAFCDSSTLVSLDSTVLLNTTPDPATFSEAAGMNTNDVTDVDTDDACLASTGTANLLFDNSALQVSNSSSDRLHDAVSSSHTQDPPPSQNSDDIDCNPATQQCSGRETAGLTVPTILRAVPLRVENLKQEDSAEEVLELAGKILQFNKVRKVRWLDTKDDVSGDAKEGGEIVCMTNTTSNAVEISRGLDVVATTLGVNEAEKEWIDVLIKKEVTQAGAKEDKNGLGHHNGGAAVQEEVSIDVSDRRRRGEISSRWKETVIALKKGQKEEMVDQKRVSGLLWELLNEDDEVDGADDCLFEDSPSDCYILREDFVAAPRRERKRSSSPLYTSSSSTSSVFSSSSSSSSSLPFSYSLPAASSSSPKGYIFSSISSSDVPVSSQHLAEEVRGEGKDDVEANTLQSLDPHRDCSSPHSDDNHVTKEGCDIEEDECDIFQTPVKIVFRGHSYGYI